MDVNVIQQVSGGVESLHDFQFMNVFLFCLPEHSCCWYCTYIQMHVVLIKKRPCGKVLLLLHVLVPPFRVSWHHSSPKPEFLKYKITLTMFSDLFQTHLQSGLHCYLSVDHHSIQFNFTYMAPIHTNRTQTKHSHMSNHNAKVASKNFLFTRQKPRAAPSSRWAAGEMNTDALPQ